MKDQSRHLSIFKRNKNNNYETKHATHKAKSIVSSIDCVKMKNTAHKFLKCRFKIDCFSPVFPLTSAILVPLANGLLLAQYPDQRSEPIRDPGDCLSRDAVKTIYWSD